MTPKEIEAAFDELARQWDGCMCAAHGVAIDIGDAIRSFASRSSIRPAQAAEPAAFQLFRDALSWGCTYGPALLVGEQWEKLRDEMAEQLVSRLPKQQAAEERKPLSDERIETVLDAADEWQRFVDEDHAPMNLRKYLSRALGIKGD